MASKQHILVIDQSTSTSSAFAFDLDGQICARATREFTQYLPRDGWIEHDADEIWASVCIVVREVMRIIDDTHGTWAGVSITNQRETVLIWERASGVPCHRALVWQDRRTATQCAQLRMAGHEEDIRTRSGLLLDPYFSASKIAWLLNHIEDGYARAASGSLACGTIDSWLIYKLTGGAHLTDATNAARTSLFNIHKNDWDDTLCALFDVPRAILPEIRDCADHFGTCNAEHFGHALPILGVAGDQQAAAIGQACFAPSMVKATYGTGCFVLANTGTSALCSQNRLLTTVGWRLEGTISYALEGSIFMAGAIIQWLRDRLELIASPDETEALAQAASSASRMLLVPAFVGLGAPHWQPHVRAAFCNMTRADGRAELVRASLMSVSLQTADLVAAIGADMCDAGLVPPHRMRIDGGMVVNDWFAQNLADLTDCELARPMITETTALGAAYLALLRLGYYNMDGLAKLWRSQKKFTPLMSSPTRNAIQEQWRMAVNYTIDTMTTATT